MTKLIVLLWSISVLPASAQAIFTTVVPQTDSIGYGSTTRLSVTFMGKALTSPQKAPKSTDTTDSQSESAIKPDSQQRLADSLFILMAEDSLRLLSEKLARLRPVTALTPPNSLLRDTPSILPIRIRSWSEYRVSSGFGLRWHPISGKLLNHAGIDLPQPLNTPVYATADGIVDKIVRQAEGIGLAVYIRHRSGYTSVYGHLAAQLVMPGEYVERGQPIALVGNSGLSTGPHLHYSVLDRGRPVNPVDFCFLLLRAIQATPPVRAARQ